MAKATDKLNLKAFNTPTRTEELAFEKKVVKMTLKKVFAWMAELYCAGHHGEVARLYKAWSLYNDYDCRASSYRFTKMWNAGVRMEGNDEVFFVAPTK